MKKIFKIIIIMTMLLLPFNAYAKQIEINGKKYEYSNFKETLKQAGIEEKFTSYEETDDQVPIYLFRGEKCEYCDSLLEFLNNNAEEYGKYFKLVSFEIYGDNKNSKLMDKVIDFMGVNVQGIPFAIIGNEYFEGYQDSYDEEIINILKKTYETSIAERVDIIQAMNEDESLNKTLPIDERIVLWNLLFLAIAIAFAIFYVNYKTKSLKKMLENNLDSKRKK